MTEGCVVNDWRVCSEWLKGVYWMTEGCVLNGWRVCTEWLKGFYFLKTFFYQDTTTIGYSVEGFYFLAILSRHCQRCTEGFCFPAILSRRCHPRILSGGLLFSSDFVQTLPPFGTQWRAFSSNTDGIAQAWPVEGLLYSSNTWHFNNSFFPVTLSFLYTTTHG